MSASKRQPWLDVAVVLGGCALAWLIFLHPIFASANDVPGEQGDTRFNIYILEHTFRWLTGQEASLLSPAIYWPYPYLLGFSDTHAGTSWVYAIFRFAGLDEYDAFKGWFALGYLASFIAAYHVGRKFGLQPLLAGPLAFAFGLSLPAVVQMGHPQLIWRVAAPYCFWFTFRYAEQGSPADLFKLLIALAIQILINVYLGVFSLVLCVLLFAGTWIGSDGLSPRAWWRRAIRSIDGFVRLGRSDWFWSGGALVAVAAAATLMAFHAYAAGQYGLTRSWGEISSMLPRPQSYLVLDVLPYWAPISWMLPDVPVRGEQQMFLGIPITVLAVASIAYALIGWRSASVQLRAFALCVVAALVLYTSFNSYTLYWFVAQIPGFDSIRAVARVMLILAFPLVMSIGLAVQQVAVRRTVAWLPGVVGLVVAGWMAADLALFQTYSFSSMISRERVARLVAMGNAFPGRPLGFPSDPSLPWYIPEIDSILAAQALGVPTLNGYTGGLPPGAHQTMSCANALIMLSAYDDWAPRHGQPPLRQLATPALLGATDCDLSAEAVATVKISSGPSLKAKHAALVVLHDLRLTPGTPPRASVRLTNNSPKTLHQLASHPLRLSWSIDPLPDVRLDTRIELGGDLAPGESREFSWDVPPGTRLEDISVSYVVEGKFWMHSLGIPPLRANP
jgi:hypothetical protein